MPFFKPMPSKDPDNCQAPSLLLRLLVTSQAELSYRQLAFLGDAVLWLLFAEHAFNKFGPFEDPIR